MKGKAGVYERFGMMEKMDAYKHSEKKAKMKMGVYQMSEMKQENGRKGGTDVNEKGKDASDESETTRRAKTEVVGSEAGV